VNESEVAYWSACAAVAPVIALALVIEARWTYDHGRGPRWAAVGVNTMFLVGGILTVTAMGISLLALKNGIAIPLAEDFLPLLLTIAASVVVVSPLTLLVTDVAVGTRSDSPQEEGGPAPVAQMTGQAGGRRETRRSRRERLRSGEKGR
jgi:hypothetical protein